MKARNLRTAGISALLVLAVALSASASHAGTLSSDVIGLFPSTVGEFAYADLRQAREFPWFSQLKEQMLPDKFRQFEQFLASAGMDPNSQVEELAWALVPTGMTTGNPDSIPTGEQIVGVALGQFQPSAAEAFFKNQKTASVKVRGYTLYGFGSGTGASDLFFVFLDGSTAAFGQRAMLEQMIAVRFGDQPNVTQNTTIYPLITQANGHSIVWAVLNPGYTRLALQQLVPGASQFAQAAPLLAKIQSMLISVQSSNGIQADFQATCATPDDAATMSSLLQAGLMLVKYQATSQNNPALAQMLETAKINPNGDRLTVSVALSNDQMLALIQSKTFALRM